MKLSNVFKKGSKTVSNVKVEKVEKTNLKK